MDFDLDEDEFLAKLREEFLQEGRESLDACEGVLLNLEKSNEADSYMKELLRLIHSIKGSAKAVEMKNLAAALHLYESYCASKDKSFIDTSFKVIDMLRASLTLMGDSNSAGGNEIITKVVAMLEGFGR